jgi:hypothetical protein
LFVEEAEELDDVGLVVDEVVFRVLDSGGSQIDEIR